MDDSKDNQLLKVIKHYQNSLDKYVERKNEERVLYCMKRLSQLPVKMAHLEQTGVGRTVNALRKLGGRTGEAARTLISQWKKMVVIEQQKLEQLQQQQENKEEEEEEDDDDDDDDDAQKEDDEEDECDSIRQDDEEEDEGVTSDHSTSSENEMRHKKSKSSSHRESDNVKVEKESHRHHENASLKVHQKEAKKDKHKSKSNGHNSSHSSNTNSTSNNTIKKQEKNKDSDSDSGSKRRHSSKKVESSSENEEIKMKESSSKHKRRRNEVVEDDNKKNKKKSKHSYNKKYKADEDDICKSEKHTHSQKKLKEYSSHKHKKEHSKFSNKSNISDEKHKTKKHKLDSVENGIDSGSGATFAEALDMCIPSTSKVTSKSRKATPESSSSKVEKLNSFAIGKSAEIASESVPKLLKEPIDLNLISLLPSITPNYRPLGNIYTMDNQPKKTLSDYEQLSNIIATKTQRTKVYSGNKTGYGKVPSLYEICIRILQDNIDALEYTGGVPYVILKPILDKATPNQLFSLEHHNPYLIEDTDELWQMHCQKEFKNKKCEEMESWREMYLRCLDEREAKLKALTANIKQSQDKSLPVRTTKLAYVDDVVKPPRNIARKQAKNGTGIEKKPTITPSARLSTLATQGEAGKVAVPNPGARAADRSGSHSMKPKKAPLMAKSLSLLKNRFRR